MTSALRVRVAVSSAMADLVAAQTELNRELWSIDLCMGYVLGRADLLGSGDDYISRVLVEADSHALRKNVEGRPKYHRRSTDFLDDVRRSRASLYTSILVKFYGAFERYLRARLGSDATDASAASRGPFLATLARDDLLAAPTPVRVETVAYVDLYRLLRNELAHGGHKVPTEVSDPIVSEWVRKLQTVPSNAFAKWGVWSDITATIARTMVRGVNRKVARAMADQSPTPAEFFYALFGFTRLNNLAFEIEEALHAHRASTRTVSRSPLRVRNTSLIRR